MLGTTDCDREGGDQPRRGAPSPSGTRRLSHGSPSTWYTCAQPGRTRVQSGARRGGGRACKILKGHHPPACGADLQIGVKSQVPGRGDSILSPFCQPTCPHLRPGPGTPCLPRWAALSPGDLVPSMTRLAETSQQRCGHRGLSPPLLPCLPLSVPGRLGAGQPEAETKAPRRRAREGPALGTASSEALHGTSSPANAAGRLLQRLWVCTARPETTRSWDSATRSETPCPFSPCPLMPPSPQCPGDPRGTVQEGLDPVGQPTAIRQLQPAQPPSSAWGLATGSSQWTPAPRGGRGTVLTARQMHELLEGNPCDIFQH